MIPMTDPDKSFVSIAEGIGSRRLSRDVLHLDKGAPDKKSHINTDLSTASHSTAVLL